jgi:hypothetical protein
MNANKTGSGFRHTGALLNAMVSSALCVLLSLFICIRHWHTVTVYIAAFMLLPSCIHLVGLFRRAKRLVSSIGSQSETNRGGIFDLVFFASLSNLLLLLCVEGLCKRIDGFF